MSHERLTGNWCLMQVTTPEKIRWFSTVLVTRVVVMVEEEYMDCWFNGHVECDTRKRWRRANMMDVALLQIPSSPLSKAPRLYPDG